MEDDLFRKIATECAREKDLKAFVPMSKNEPLLDRKLEERIAEFKTYSAPHQFVEIVTNGSALTPSRFNKLVASGVDLISISLNAATEEVFQQVKHGVSWRQVKRNIDAIAQKDTSRVNIFLRYIQQLENSNSLLKFWLYWGRQGFNIVSFDINNRSDTVRNYEGLVPNRKLLMNQLYKAMGRLFYGLCPQAFSVAHVMHNGDVPMCSNDWHNREILGNVNQNTIREIFNSPRIQEIRELMFLGHYDAISPCRECSIRINWLGGGSN
jgi:radical SAM protein with 4Fe4S-binding SPASM domain